MRNKKAQGWGFDLIIGLTIFLFGILFFYLYVINIPLSEKDDYDALRDEAAVIANSLVSEGSPTDWDETNVVRIGLLTGKRVDEDKWHAFDLIDYDRARVLLRATDNFYVYFNNDTSDFRGKYLDGSNESVIRVTRVVVRNNESATLNVVSWK